MMVVKAGLAALALSAGALVMGAATPAMAQRAGLYEITGTSLDGSSYRGVMALRQVGLYSWEVQWQIGGDAVRGVAMSAGTTLSIAFSVGQNPGMTIYSINPDGSMTGQWTMIGSNGIGTESAIPRQ